MEERRRLALHETLEIWEGHLKATSCGLIGRLAALLEL